MTTKLLHSTVGNSDKVYRLSIVQRGSDGYYDVVYSNGRRSSGPTSGNKAKNKAPIRSHSSAMSLLNRLTIDKIDEGYHFVGECVLCRNQPITQSQASQMAAELLSGLVGTGKKMPLKPKQKKEQIRTTTAAQPRERRLALDKDI